MNRRLLGWFPALAIAAIVLVALFLGAWKSASVLLLPGLVSMPIRWRLPGLGFLATEGIEKGALCLMLTVLGTIALGVEAAARQEKIEPVQKHSEARERPSRRGESSRDEKQKSGRSTALPVSKEARAAAFKLAVANAHACDTAHRRAAGAIHGMNANPETRAAVANAVSSCEASWIVFNRPELRGDPASVPDSEESDGMRACDHGYMGRWLANDDLLTALDAGMPAQEIGRIERMNNVNDASVTACGALMRQRGAHSS